MAGADPDDTVARLVIATELRASGLDAHADLGRRKLGKQLEAAARDAAHFAVILWPRARDRRGAVRGPAGWYQKLVARSDLARELARAHAAHRHGTE